jgi:hypothetical protein
MKFQKDHIIKLSFQVWLDHYLMSRGEAFSTGNFPLYYTDDERLPDGYLSYSSPFKQWAWDSSIENILIPTGLYSGESFLPIDNNNILADFDNGRFIVKTNDTNLNLSADFSYKDFNIYISDQSEETLLTEKPFQENSKYYISEKGVPPYRPAIPAIFINFKDGDSKPFQMGGTENVIHYVTIIAMSDNEFQLDGAKSIIRDAKNLSVPIINNPINDGSGACYPFGSNWSTDIGGYDYQGRILNNTSDSLDYIIINKTSVSSISTEIVKNLDLSVYVKFIDLELNVIYNPRE